jgi:hypothetical protein
MGEESNIHELFQEYIVLSKEINELKKFQKDKKTILDKLGKNIHEYMVNNDMDSISLKDAEIVLYNRKISQTFKKETITEKLTEKLNDQSKAEELAQSIVQNKKFIVENKLKVVLKKK